MNIYHAYIFFAILNFIKFYPHCIIYYYFIKVKVKKKTINGKLFSWRSATPSK